MCNSKLKKEERKNIRRRSKAAYIGVYKLCNTKPVFNINTNVYINTDV